MRPTSHVELAGLLETEVKYAVAWIRDVKGRSPAEVEAYEAGMRQGAGKLLAILADQFGMPYSTAALAAKPASPSRHSARPRIVQSLVIRA